jgi:hypothetical protein
MRGVETKIMQQVVVRVNPETDSQVLGLDW